MGTFTTDALCAAAETTLPFAKEAATECTAKCLATECCSSKQKCGDSGFTDASCAAAEPTMPYYDTTKGHTECTAKCGVTECCSSKQRCGDSKFKDDAECKSADATMPFYDTSKATTECTASPCTVAECCSSKQTCGDSALNNDAACSKADLALPFYEKTKAATECKAACTAKECCGAVAPASCFPGDATVVVHGFGSMPLHSLRIGDRVLSGNRQFEPVLSLLHMDVGASTATADLHPVRGASV